MTPTLCCNSDILLLWDGEVVVWSRWSEGGRPTSGRSARETAELGAFLRSRFQGRCFAEVHRILKSAPDFGPLTRGPASRGRWFLRSSQLRAVKSLWSPLPVFDKDDLLCVCSEGPVIMCLFYMSRGPGGGRRHSDKSHVWLSNEKHFNPP